MPRALAVWLVLCTSLWAARAGAADKEAPQPGARGGSRLSLGAGFGFAIDAGGSGSIGLSGGSAVSVNAYTPIGSALLEVAVSRHLRLMAAVNGSYTKQRAEATNDQALRYPDGPTSRWTVGGALGARWVLTPGGVVEVSPALLLGVHAGVVNSAYGGTSYWSDGQPHELRTTSDVFGYDARLGLVLERLLMQNLYLRFDVYFVRLGFDGWTSHTYGEQAGPVHSERREYGVGYGVSPFLQLRLTF